MSRSICLPGKVMLREKLMCIQEVQNLGKRKSRADGTDAVKWTLQKSHSHIRAPYLLVTNVDRPR
jgi:hypothetical protein